MEEKQKERDNVITIRACTEWKRIRNNRALLLHREENKGDFGKVEAQTAILASNPMLPPRRTSFRALFSVENWAQRRKISTRGAGWMNEFPPRALGYLSFPAKWHGTRFVSGELDRIEIPLYIYICTGRVSFALINSLQVRERGRAYYVSKRPKSERVKLPPLRFPRRYVENFNGINMVQVFEKREESPGSIQREGARFFVIFATQGTISWILNHGARHATSLDDNDNAKLSRRENKGMKTEMKVSKRKLFRRECDDGPLLEVSPI